MITTLSFAGIQFNLEADHEIKKTFSFTNFMNIESNIKYKITFQSINQLDLVSSTFIAHKFEYDVYEDYILFHDPRNGKEYAYLVMDYPNRKGIVKYLKEDELFVSETRNSFAHICFEKILIEENRFLLHSSCINTNYGGILFSGPSGIGKSTQADLWIKYEDAKMINGDRPILHKENGIWLAYGSPYAGSSRCHINEHTNVRCIVILKQDKECKIRKLSASEAFRKIYSNVTTYTWDRVFVEKAMDLVLELINDITIYELSCTPDKNAVDLLKETLEME